MEGECSFRSLRCLSASDLFSRGLCELCELRVDDVVHTAVVCVVDGVFHQVCHCTALQDFRNGERTIACTLFVAESVVHVEKSQSFAQWPPLLDCEDSYHGVPP